MSGVVLRCPNCGTIQPVEGECDACHDAAVQFFCTNHTPGLWLEGSACPQCGARFGDPVQQELAPAPNTPEEPRRAAPPEVGVPPVRRSAEAGEPEFREAGVPTRMDAGRSSPAGTDAFRILMDAMMSAARARSTRADHIGYEDSVRMRPRGGGCCLGRLLALALLLIALVVLAPMLFLMFFGSY